MENRIGVVAILLEEVEQSSAVNEILHQYREIIVGRMGLPYKERGISVISIIVDGSTDAIGALTGKLGKIPGVSVKSALSKGGKP